MKEHRAHTNSDQKYKDAPTILPENRKQESHGQVSEENWAKILKHLEEDGATNNDYYIRAKAICQGEKDPIQVIEPLTILENPEA